MLQERFPAKHFTILTRRSKRVYSGFVPQYQIVLYENAYWTQWKEIKESGFFSTRGPLRYFYSSCFVECVLLILSKVLSLNHFDSRIKHSCLRIDGEVVCKKNFEVFLQLMAITLYMLAEIVRSLFTCRDDPSKLCSWTSLPCCDLKPFSRVISPLESE